MSRCTICSKSTMAGRNIRHKHTGLWERKAPATVRVFNPNIQKQTVLMQGKKAQISLCTKCLKRIKHYPGWKGYSLPNWNKIESADTTKTSEIAVTS